MALKDRVRKLEQHRGVIGREVIPTFGLIIDGVRKSAIELRDDSLSGKEKDFHGSVILSFLKGGEQWH